MMEFMKINYLLRTFVIFFIVSLLIPDFVNARPTTNSIISRQKRTSDQRLAELETLIGLSKLHGKLVTVPIGFGHVDPERIGRKRRSSYESVVQKLRRVLQDFQRDNESVSEENNKIFNSSWQNEDNDAGGINSQIVRMYENSLNNNIHQV